MTTAEPGGPTSLGVEAASLGAARRQGIGDRIVVRPDRVIPVFGRKAHEPARREGDVLRVNNGKNTDASITPEWIESELYDPQLAAALRALTGKIETSDWPIVGESGITELVKQQNRENLIRRRDRINEALAKVKLELAKLDGDVDDDADSDSHDDNLQATDKEEAMDQPVAEDKVGDEPHNLMPSDQIEQPAQREAEDTEPADESRLPQSNEFPTESP